MKIEPRSGLEFSYNILNLSCEVHDSQQNMQMRYTYLSDGTKISALDAAGKGHLGNVRAVIDISASGNASADDVILEQDDYLPYGTKVVNGSQSSLSSNRYRYAGKEEQRIGSFNSQLLDFGARSYDPWACRWTAVDPLAHKYFGMSPYNYCGNDPVNRFDPDGGEVVVPTVPIWFKNTHLALEMLSASAAAVFSVAGPALALIGTAFLCASDTPLDQSSSVQNSKQYYPPSPGWVRGQQHGEKEKQDKIAVDFQKAVKNSGMGNNNNDFKPNNNGKGHSKIETAVLSFLALVNTCTGGGSGQVVATSNGNNQNQQPNQNGNDAQVSPSNNDDCENNNQSSINAFMDFLIQIFNAQQN